MDGAECHLLRGEAGGTGRVAADGGGRDQGHRQQNRSRLGGEQGEGTKTPEFLAQAAQAETC